MRRVRAGVIGLGAMGRQHARVYASLPEVELVGVADLDVKAVDATANQHRVAGFQDYRDLLKMGAEVVTVAVPTVHHHKVGMDVLEAGVNLLMEKPIADTVANAYELTNKALQKGLKLMVGHIERFNPAIAGLKESIKENRVLSVGTTRVGPIPPRIQDVGVVIDLAIHDIDLIRYIAQSEIVDVKSSISSYLGKHEDAVVLSFKLENGVLAYTVANWLTPFKIREVNVATREKFVKAGLIEQRVVEYSHYDPSGSYVVKELNIRQAEPLKLELEAFIRAVAGEGAIPITGEDGLRALEIAHRALEQGC